LLINKNEKILTTTLFLFCVFGLQSFKEKSNINTTNIDITAKRKIWSKKKANQWYKQQPCLLALTISQETQLIN
tara:strand:- start:8100 stop:8321 length:222 start_codon:yes stop_codon:yes gene_type:complete